LCPIEVAVALCCASEWRVRMFVQRPLSDRTEGLRDAVLMVLQACSADIRMQDPERAANYPHWGLNDVEPLSLSDLRERLVPHLSGVADFAQRPYFDSELRDAVMELGAYKLDDNIRGLLVDDYEQAPSKFKAFSGPSVDFLNSVGITEESHGMSFGNLQQMDVAELKALLDTYSDLGGNTTPDGFKVRTPYAGTPPEFWSTPEAYQSWVSKVGATAAKEILDRLAAENAADAEGGEEY